MHRTIIHILLLLSLLIELNACNGHHSAGPKVTPWNKLREDRPVAKDPWAHMQKAPQRQAETTPKKNIKSNKINKLGDMGSKLDQSVNHFIAIRARQHIRSAELPPPQILQQWKTTFNQMEQALDLQPSHSDLGALIRARVSLEVEMDRDQQRFKALPENLNIGYIGILEKIDKRVRELHASQDDYGFGGKIPRQVKSLILDWPLQNFRVSSPFGYRRDPFHGRYKFHAGIDLAAALDTPVYAAAPGVVVFARYSGGWGNYVVIEHPNGVRSHYAHMDHLFVSPGTVLDDRSIIGAVGSTGRSTGPHLHFGISLRGRYVDPSLYTRTAIAPDGSIGGSS